MNSISKTFPFTYISGNTKKFPPIISNSNRMKSVIEIINKVAVSTVTVLLQGETGTGKGLFANILHQLSDRNRNPFIEIDCTNLHENLIASEIFGHEKGAFTDAITQKKGLIELANNGTLFLDEIGNLTHNIQMKLLKAVEEKKFRRLGGTCDIEVDIRIIAATNTDLKLACKDNRFRADLYYRLNAVCIYLPSLRERKEDIIPLANWFIKEVCQKYQKEVKQLSPKTQSILLNYHWPGNVRELKNMIERAILLCSGDIILPVHFPEEIQSAKKRYTSSFRMNKQGMNYYERVTEFERNLIMHTFKNTNKIIEAAQLLDLPESSLRSIIKRLHINREHILSQKPKK